MEQKAKRSTLPIVSAALKKALDQLILAQNAATLSGHHAIATTIASAVIALRQLNTQTMRALMH